MTRVVTICIYFCSNASNFADFGYGLHLMLSLMNKFLRE